MKDMILVGEKRVKWALHSPSPRGPPSNIQLWTDQLLGLRTLPRPGEDHPTGLVSRCSHRPGWCLFPSTTTWKASSETGHWAGYFQLGREQRLASTERNNYPWTELGFSPVWKTQRIKLFASSLPVPQNKPQEHLKRCQNIQEPTR